MRDGPDLDVGDGSGSGSATAARRKAITIDKAMVAGSVDNFPVYVDLTDTDLAASARADGHDIYFTDAAGTTLPHEIESWSGGRLLAWVRLPHLDSSTSTRFYILYGDVSKAAAPAPATTFSTYSAVWHLDDALDGGVADATGMTNATPMGLQTTDQVAGKLGGSVHFDGSGNEHIDFTNPLTGTGPHTISAWVNQQTVNHNSAIVTVGTNNNDQARFVYGSYGGGDVGAGLYNDDWTTTNTDIENAGWKLVHFTYEGMNKKAHLFVNGVEIMPAKTFMNAANTAAGTGYIGFAPQPSFGNPTEMLGQLDEVRISTTTRNAAWCATEFANQSSPSTFYAVGAEEPAP